MPGPTERSTIRARRETRASSTSRDAGAASTKFQRTGFPAISSDNHRFGRTNRAMFASFLKSSASSALLGFVVASLMSPPFVARAFVEIDGIDGIYSSDVLDARPSRSVARRPRVADATIRELTQKRVVSARPTAVIS